MSKVLILTNNDMYIYNLRLELVERLLAEGHKVVVSSPHGERVDDLVALGCEHRETRMARHGMNPKEEIGLIWDYIKILKQEDPDIVFTYTIKPNIYGAIACRPKNVPCVINITGLGTAVENKGPVRIIAMLLYRYATAKVQRVFFQNVENREFFLKRGIACENNGLLPGSGVNLERFSPIEYPNTDKIEFAFISRIMKEKGIDQYLEAAEYIRERYPDTVFHVCGYCEQAYEKKLRALHDRGVINYHGMVRDVRTILKDIHCTVHPTYYPEGISNVLLESAACGRPLITTDRSGCREVIVDGVNGFVVKQRDSQDLIEKIEKFIGLSWEDKRQMGLAGRQKVEREFDRQIVVEKYMQELEQAQLKKKKYTGNPDN